MYQRIQPSERFVLGHNVPQCHLIPGTASPYTQRLFLTFNIFRDTIHFHLEAVLSCQWLSAANCALGLSTGSILHPSQPALFSVHYLDAIATMGCDCGFHSLCPTVLRFPPRVTEPPLCRAVGLANFIPHLLSKPHRFALDNTDSVHSMVMNKASEPFQHPCHEGVELGSVTRPPHRGNGNIKIPHIERIQETRRNYSLPKGYLVKHNGRER